MRRMRIAMICLLVGVALLEVLLVTAQDRLTPWPPPPVRRTRDDGRPPPAPLPPVKSVQILAPAVPREAPGTIVHASVQEGPASSVTTAVGEALPPPSFPSPLPSEPAAPVVPVPLDLKQSDAPPALALPPAIAPAPQMSLPVIPDPPATKVPAGAALPEVASPPPLTPPMSPQVEKPARLPEFQTAPARPAEPRLREFTRIRAGAAADVQPRPGTMPALPIAPSPAEVHRVLLPQPSAVDGHAQALPRLAPAAAPPADSHAAWSFQTPRLVVEKRGPAALQAGETAVFHITVRNTAEEPSAGLQIEEALPATVMPAAAEPEATVRDGRVRWSLPGLAARSEATVALSVQASAPVRLGNTTTVHLSATGTAPALPVEARPPTPTEPLAVRVQGPANVAVGLPATFRITFANQGREPLRDLKLFAYLPDGLSHPAGPHLETDVPLLAPGAARTESVTTTAVRAGRFSVSVKLISPTGQEAEAQAAIDVGSGGLTVQHVAGTRLVVGQEAEVRFEVANQTARPLRRVDVLYVLPDGLDFAVASDQGQYQVNSRTVYWLLEQLTPGQAKAVAIKVVPRKAGAFPGEVAARAEGMPEAKVPVNLAAEGAPELSVLVVDDENPLALGKDTTYKIRLVNSGSVAATNVAVQVAIAEGLQPNRAGGPTRFEIGLNDVRFEPLPHLPPQGEQVYRVLARARQPGEQRVRVQVSSDQARTPVTRDHATHVESGAAPGPQGAGWTPPARVGTLSP